MRRQNLLFRTGAKMYNSGNYGVVKQILKKHKTCGNQQALDRFGSGIHSILKRIKNISFAGAETRSGRPKGRQARDLRGTTVQSPKDTTNDTKVHRMWNFPYVNVNNSIWLVDCQVDPS